MLLVLISGLSLKRAPVKGEALRCTSSVVRALGTSTSQATFSRPPVLFCFVFAVSVAGFDTIQGSLFAGNVAGSCCLPTFAFVLSLFLFLRHHSSRSLLPYLVPGSFAQDVSSIASSTSMLYRASVKPQVTETSNATANPHLENDGTLA